MNLTRELKEKLEADLDLLQSSAVHILIEVCKTYDIKFSTVALEIGTTEERVLEWITNKKPTSFECGLIFKFVDTQLFPIEWEIRGAILGDYNNKVRVPKARTFIEILMQRLAKEGFDGEDGSRELALLVDRGTSTIYEMGTNPGFFRIFLGIRRFGENLYTQVGRIELERDMTVGGDFQIHLPAVPEALNETTMRTYIPHEDHTFTISDWDEMIRWVKEGKIVESNFYLESYERSFERDFPRLGRKKTA